MDEPGKELELVVPGRLTRLIQLGHAAQVGSPRPARRQLEHPAVRGSGSVLAPLSPTDELRIRRLFRTEIAQQRSGYLRPSWIESEEAVPGLVVSMQYTRQDAHGIAQRTRDLDIAFRRAASTLENYYAGERNQGWAQPMRPERGGLWVVDARRGSYELLATVYGSLVSLATSTPVSLASLVSLAWDSAVAASRAGRWAVGKFNGTPDEGPPQIGAPHGEGKWGVKQTKALAPVMLEAAKAGNGVEFVSNSVTGEVRLTIYPQKELTGKGA